MAMYIVEIRLNKKTPITIKNGDIILDRGYSTVTVRNIEANSNEEAEKMARENANQLLNELTIEYGIKLLLKGGITIGKQSSPDERHIEKYRMKTWLAGYHRKLPPREIDSVDIKASDAKYYYRAALMATNHYDEFRNFYLAIENIAYNKAIINASRGKRDCLTYILEMCFSSDEERRDLKDHTHTMDFKDTGYIYKDVSDFLYEENRNQLNHAKPFKSKRLPFRDEDMMEVGSACFLAEYIAKKLIEYYDNQKGILMI